MEKRVPGGAQSTEFDSQIVGMVAIAKRKWLVGQLWHVGSIGRNPSPFLSRSLFVSYRRCATVDDEKREEEVVVEHDRTQTKRNRS
jgi:hypothetical protein